MGLSKSQKLTNSNSGSVPNDFCTIDTHAVWLFLKVGFNQSGFQTLKASSHKLLAEKNASQNFNKLMKLIVFPLRNFHIKQMVMMNSRPTEWNTTKEANKIISSFSMIFGRRL